MTDDKAGQVKSKLTAGGTNRDIENTPKCTRPTIQSKSTTRRAALDLVMMMIMMIVKVMMMALLVITRRGLGTEIIQMRSVHALWAVVFLLLCISYIVCQCAPKISLIT